MQALIGLKKSQSQKFLENGTRIPVTLIDCKDNRVIAVQTQEKNHYQAVQLGFSIKKKGNKAEVGHAKEAKLEGAPKFLREVRILADEQIPEVGLVLNPSEVLQPGDMVDITGVSKGKGFAGVVKRHGFHGGPKTHGQSDRHRAPGSIGQGTTPGRVYRGKRMAGRMGSDNVTIQNLEIVDVTSDGVLVVKGLVPGIINSLLVIKKVGEDKKFVPLWQEPSDAEAMEGQGKVEEEIVEAAVDAQVEEPVAEVATEEVKVEAPTEENKEEAVEETPAEATEETKEEVIEETKEEVKEEENANS